MVIKAASGADYQDRLHKAREKETIVPCKPKMRLKAMLRIRPSSDSSLIRNEPLDERGWALQESWLAQRMLVFDFSQTRRECRTCTPTEGGRKSLDG